MNIRPETERIVDIRKLDPEGKIDPGPSFSLRESEIREFRLLPGASSTVKINCREFSVEIRGHHTIAYGRQIPSEDSESIRDDRKPWELDIDAIEAHANEMADLGALVRACEWLNFDYR